MDIYSKEYLEENIDAVNRNFKARKAVYNIGRFKILKRFCSGATKILDVGCGGHEPVVIGATHACDIAPNALQYLTQLGWKGEFKVCSCTDLPYPTKSFDVVVCSEVIEHLPTMDDVIKTFNEVDRVGKRWIVTTPANPLGPKNPEKTHKRDFTFKSLEAILQKFKVYIHRDELYFYVEKK